MERIINRVIENEEYRKLLDEISDAIDRCVDYGDTVFNILGKYPRDEYVDASLALLLRDFLEFLDGISVLIRNSCIEAAIPVLRSMFEHYLAILFILEKHQSNRATAYQVAHIRSRLKVYKKFSSGEVGQLTKMLDNSEYNFPLPDIDTSEDIERLEHLLLKGKYKIINDEWENTRMKYGKKQVNWYSLYNGPKTFFDFAAYLNKEVDYEFLYRTWSAKSHANAAFNSAIETGGFKMLRHPESLKTVSTWAFTWTFTLFQEILEYYKKEKQ